MYGGGKEEKGKKNFKRGKINIIVVATYSSFCSQVTKLEPFPKKSRQE